MSPMKKTDPEGYPDEFVQVDLETGELLPEEKPADVPRDPIRFKIFKHFGVIGSTYQNRDIELNWVSWNDGSAKYDIRAWDRIHEHMSKGITLFSEEIIALRDLLNTIDFERYRSQKPVRTERKGESAPEAPEEKKAKDAAETPEEAKTIDNGAETR